MAKYTAKPVTTANMVPRGRDFAGFFRSPDIAIPASIPVTAGKNTANTVQKGTFNTAVVSLLETTDSTLEGSPIKKEISDAKINRKINN